MLPADLTAQLNKIYAPALLEWKVEVKQASIYFDFKDGKLEAGDHALLASYSAEMKALMRAYFMGDKNDAADGRLYVFVVPGFDDGSVQGYMPRGRNVGFVSQANAWTIAHELGHGWAGLQHTFPAQPQGSTQNLMDYGGNTYLTAVQWDKIQNPGVIINWFDSEEDAMSQSTISYALCIENASAYSGKVFKVYQEGFKRLKANTLPYAFTVDGELYSFKVDGNVYVPFKNVYGHWGYALKGSTPKEADKYVFESANGAAAVNVTLEQLSSATTLRLESSGFTASKCFETTATDTEWLTEAGRGQLSGQLKALAANNTEITIKECGKPTSHTVTAASTAATAGQKDIQIELCWDGKAFKISSHRFKAGALQVPSGYTGTPADVEAKSNAAVDKVKENGIAATQSDDGELTYKSLSFVEAVVAVKEATLTLCNDAKVPEKFWDDKTSSPFHGPTLSGIGDGAIAELKDIPELVGFGLEIATDPDKAKATWSGIKSMTPAKVKKMLLGAATDKIAKYTAGGNTMKHEAGKDGVQMAMFVFGGVTKIKDGANLIDDLGSEVVAKLDNVADEALSKIDDAVEADAGKGLNKFIKESDLNPTFYTHESGTLNIAKTKKGSKLTQAETEQILNQEKAFVETGNLDEIAKVGSPLPDGTLEYTKGTKGGWNKELNKPLKADSKYKIGKNTYETDAQGRVTNAKGELDLKTAERNGYQQRKGVTSKDGDVSTDQGGHLIAAIFNGAGEQINYVPMLQSLNQGVWKSMENTWKTALDAGKKVEVDIKIIYEGTSKRPKKFEIIYKVNDDIFEREFFN